VLTRTIARDASRKPKGARKIRTIRSRDTEASHPTNIVLERR